MRKKTTIQKRSPKSADSLLKTRKKKDIELTEQESEKSQVVPVLSQSKIQGSLWTPLPVI